MHDNHKKIAGLVISIGILALSSASILIRLCDAAPLVIAVYRVGLASIFYTGVAGITQKSLLKVSIHDIKWAVLSGAFLAFHFATWITSLSYTTVASSVVLVQTSPIFVAIGSAVFLKERLHWKGTIGIVIAITGGMIIAGYDAKFQNTAVFGNALAVLGALGASGYFLMGRKLRRSMNTFQYVVWVYGAAAVILLIYILFTQPQILIDYNREALLVLIAIAFIPQVIGHTSLNWALKYFSAATVAILTLGEAVGSSLLAWLLLNEPLPVYKMIGGIILLCGVVVVLLNEKYTEQSIPD